MRSNKLIIWIWTFFSVSSLLLLPSSLLAQSGSEIGYYFGQGWLTGLAFVFVLGLTLNLTPCVYPMIPITVGYFGNRRDDSWIKRTGHAFLYLLGMALIYTLLGAMAGLTGQMLGEALQSPIIQGFLALVMVLMAASMFGFFNLTVDESVRRNIEDFADGLGTFGMGMTLGIAAAPCLAPATVALLSYVGSRGSIVLGCLLFFVLSLGLGLPYVILSIFTQLIDTLPVAGDWFKWLERLIGHLLLGVALYFLWPLLPEDFLGILIIVWLTGASLSLVITARPENKLLFGIRTVLIVLICSIAVYWVLFNLIWLTPKLNWTSGKTFIKNPSIEKPTFVYTTADWCVPCKEMKVTTFQSNKVKRASRDLQLIKIDMTKEPPKNINQWLMQYEVVGIPTLLFLKPGGEEIKSLRGQGYMGGDELAERLEKLKQQTGESYFSFG